MGKDFDKIIDEIIEYRSKRDERISTMYNSIINSLASEASKGEKIETSYNITNVDYSEAEAVMALLREEGFVCGVYGSGNSIFLNTAICEKDIENLVAARTLRNR